MKKILLFGAVAAFALTFASCEKDWTCHCKGQSFLETPATTVDYTNTVEGTKSKAKSKCEEQNIDNERAKISCALEVK